MRGRPWYGCVFLLALLLAACGPADSTPRPDDVAERPTAAIPAARTGDSFVVRNAEINLRPGRDEVELVFLGDSITQRWESTGRYVWNEHYADRHAANFGINADLTQHVLWRIENGNFDGMRPKLIVLLIGTNNMHLDDDVDVVRGVRAIIEELRERMPRTRILLLGLFPRQRSAAAPIRIRLTAINQQLDELSGQPGVTFLDIGRALLEPDGSLSARVMPDGLHLSPRGYTIWAETMEPTLERLLAAD